MIPFRFSRPMTRIWSRLGHLSGTTLLLVLTGIFSRGITLLTQIVIAYRFGVSIFSDAYFAVENVPELFMEFVGIGLSMAFIPMFAEYRIAKSEGDARQFANAFLLVTTAVSVICAVLAFIGAPVLVTIMAPGFASEPREIAITLVRIMALSLVLIGLEASSRGLLHAHQEFAVSEVSRIVYNLSLCGAAWFLGEQMGITVLAWGVVLGALAQLVIQFGWVLRKGLFKVSLVWYHPGIRRVLRQLLPYIIAISSVNIILLLDRMVASGLEAGSVAALTFATRIILLPIGIFVLPLRTALYPTISNLAAEEKHDEIAASAISGLCLLLFIVIPACVGLTMLRIPLTRLIFEHGAFDSVATSATGDALLFYALGVPAIAVIFFMSGVYFALSRPLALMWLTLFIWVANLGFNLSLSHFFSYRGVALGTTLATTLMACLMLVILKRASLPSLHLATIGRSLIKIGAAAAVMGLALVPLAELINMALTALALDYQIIQLGLLSLVGALTYLVVAYLLKSNEMLLVTTKSRSILQRQSEP